MMPDEFEIKATGNKPERIWTRNNLHASKMIADQAISKLGYAKAEVVNTFGGDRSDSLYTVEGSKWENDSIQFPRLLAEIRAVGLTDEQLHQLSESMNLAVGEIAQLLKRAEQAWEKLKPGPCDACGMNTCLVDEVICPTCKSAGKGKEGDKL